MLLLIGLFALVLPPGLGFAQDGVRLPDLQSSGQVLPPDEEREFPAEVERALRAQGLLVDDTVVQSFFTDMGYRLVAHSDKREQEFHFHVLRIPGINAFAAPAGVVGINAGLILAAESEHEVAGVVAHEIAHVTQNHLARSMEEAQRVSLPLMLATLGAVLAGSAAGGMSGEAAQGIMATGMGLAQQAQINYTRQNEIEADRIGISLMARAGYDTQGMTDFFNTLNRASRAQGSGPPEYLRTHPLTVNRVAEARERSERIQTRRLHVSGMFHYAQARLRVQMESQPAKAVEYFEAQLDQDGQPEAAMRYGLALAQMRARRLDQAEAQVDMLLELQPENQLFRLLQGELLMTQGKSGESLELLDQIYHDYGDSQLVAVSYAEALLRDDDPEQAAEAMEILRRQMRRRPGDVQVSGLLAQAANRAGEPVRAAEAVAENYYYRGGLPQAIEQLERVMRRDDLNYYERARISARLEELRAEFARSSHHQPSSG